MKDGSNTKEGFTYHELPGSGIPAQRLNLSERVDFILSKVDVKGKKVLDLGCNVGGISYLLGRAGAFVDGVDYDSNAIENGNEFLKGKRLEGSVNLRVAEITNEFINSLGEYDVVIWLSQWQWLVKQSSLEDGLQALFDISKKGKVLVFESSADDGRASIKGSTQDTINVWLIKNTAYSNIERYKKEDGWNKRDLFICSNPIFEWHRHRGVSVSRSNRNGVRKANLIGNLTLQMLRCIDFIKELKDTPIAPKLIGIGESSFTMSYEGSQIKKLREEDIQLIIKHLKEHKIIHRDIIPSNLLWNGTNVILIDYGWAIHEGGEFECPPQTGGKYRCPEGFNDEYSLRKIKEELDASCP